MMVDGPGALAYPIPALIWCALRYSLFVTTLFTFVFSVTLLIATASGMLPLLMSSDDMLFSVATRLAIGMTVLGPLAIASTNREREDLVARLQHAATHDALTGSLTRGAFMSLALEAISNNARRRQPVAVLMIDVDHFKKINDTYGHASGDKVLIEIARILESGVRKGDLMGRRGGEEFAVLCPDVTRIEAERISERLRASVETSSFNARDSRSFGTTISIGLAFDSAGMVPCLHTLLAQADNALYAAKSAGRNQTVFETLPASPQSSATSAAA